ncbi:hypothetical protein E4U41_005238 [Claviceps citrina]|nr:hypothetical protein E4U41_005238 [Claviceps citrina]
MGLPLFVEPAKSIPSNNVLSKNGAKSTTSPSHTDSRHPSSRSEIRDRRNGIRRAGVRVYGSMQRIARNPPEQRNLPWVESPSEQDRAGFSRENPSPRTFRDALRDMASSDDRRGELIEERMGSIIRNGLRDSPPAPGPPPPPPPPLSHIAVQADSMTEDPDLGWWPFESTFPTGQSGRPQRQQRAASALVSWRDLPRVESSFRTVPSLFGRTVSGVDTSLPRIVRHSTRGLPNSRLPTRARSRSRSLSSRQQLPPRRATRVVDGLGDRDRSLSPEVWDTLLSTLTPDPQPPSAGSSFASMSASQTAGPSSSTASTAPDVVDEVQAEAVCDSGCEYSDNELDTTDHEPPDYALNRRRRQDVRDVTLGDVHPSRVPDYNLDGMSEPDLGNMGSLATESFAMNAVPSAQRTRNSGHGRPGRQTNTLSGSLTIYESTMRLRPSAEVSHQSASRSVAQSDWSEASPPPQQGRLPHDQERHVSGSSQQVHDATSSASTAGPSPAEDDWAGMQRIVRSLARREDIPDGWWAEAGLSRILQQRAHGSGQDDNTSNDIYPW